MLPMSIRRASFVSLVVAAFVALAACGGNPAGFQTNCGGVNGTRGSMGATVDGTTFAAIVPNGGAGQTGSILQVFGQDAENTIVQVSTTSNPGSVTIGVDAGINASVLLQTHSCTTPTGIWGALAGSGSGTITITSLTTSSVAGTFSGTLVAQPGSGATGTKTITNGTFSANFGG